ncbi:Ankyrin repeat-containing domain protein [Mycena venus]|uniref:Ankyrin repeat-containing domain protein n=1 Tax=Mycena venus TaxID=2733690 RepID=A0A8H7D1N0_9AGAR|nr:Ankyrin repeat-containing domain protein [Mycena venus]
MPFESVNNYYISHVSGGTGGTGGRGGQKGGGGGAGHGPSFQAETIVIQIDPAEREKIIDRQPGTGEWLLQDSLFQKWRAGEIRAVWCRGIPGAGKTVLASIVVDDLQRNGSNENTSVAVLYLDYKATTETHSVTNLLAAIWRQLVHGKPLTSAVLQLYNAHKESRTRPSREEIHSLLRSMVDHSWGVFVVIDALDEYPEDDRDALLQHLWELPPAVRLMLTSRPHINFNYIIPKIETFDVRATEEDIRQYLDGQIKKFLLAKLWLDPLMTKHNVRDVQDALENLSSGLDGAYDGIVNRINQQSEGDRQLAWRTLSWVFNAKTPLRPSELQEALSVEPEATMLDPGRRTDMDIISSVCAGLVVVDEADDKHGADVNARGRHGSALDAALLKEHGTIIQLLLEHGADVNGGGNMYTPLQKASELGNESIVRLLVEHGADVNAQGSCGSALNIAVHKENGDIVQLLLEHGADANVGGTTYNTPLQTASGLGNEGIVKLLLEHGADVNAQGLLDGSALQAASIEGHEEIVKLLLESGANINAISRAYGSALQAASWRGHEAIVKLLLAHSAHVNGERGKFGSALQAASQEGHEAIVKLLLEHGAHINAEWGSFSSALQATSREGHEAIVKLLLEHGAHIKAEEGSFSSVLQGASWEGHEAIVKLLLEHGANVNETDQWYGSALQTASRAGHESIVKLLLDHGANVNERGRRYGNALQGALRAGHGTIVKLLLKHGANIKAEGRLLGSALQAANNQGNEGIPKLLLEQSINAGGGWPTSILDAYNSSTPYAKHQKRGLSGLDSDSDLESGTPREKRRRCLTEPWI